jgi:hypothetical protein
VEANGAACAKTGSHAPKGGGTQGAVPGPCEFVETGGSACDAEGPGVNAKPQGKGVGGPAMHAVGAGGNAEREGGDAVGKGSELGGALGGGTGERVRARARAFAAADKASGLARVPDRPPPAYGSV